MHHPVRRSEQIFYDFMEAAINLFYPIRKVPAQAAEFTSDVTGPCVGLPARINGPFTSPPSDLAYNVLHVLYMITVYRDIFIRGARGALPPLDF